MVSKPDAVHKRQQEYVDSISTNDEPLDIIIAGAFIQSIRELGYKSAATAADELIDNSIEAGAENVHLAFGYGPKSDAKPTQVAVLDDGYGMVPGMVGAASRWGGTDREGSRNLFGRFGYGLPSASVSQGKAFSVFSRVDGGPFFGVTIDVDEVRQAKRDKSGRFLIATPTESALPAWIVSYAEENFPGGVGALRTVVVWDKLDKITWKTTTALETNLLQHFGLVYRGFLRQTSISVNGKAVGPIDPLFITPGYRFYDVDDDRAEALPPLKFEVKDDHAKSMGEVTMRVSFMPPGFLSKDKSKAATSKNANPRFAIRKENNGIIVCRNGRQIDVVTRTPLLVFQNNDRYLGFELDFPAALDEEFGVTTAKQQISISDRIWDHLRQAGFPRVISSLSKRYEEERADRNVGREESPDVPKASEAVMEEAAHLIRRRPTSEDANQEAEDNMRREVDRLARETGLPPDLIADQKQKEADARPYLVERESVTDAPFYRVEQRGGQMVLLINTAHRFFTDVYAVQEGHEGARIRASLELLLFVLGECELDTNEEGKIWYVSERIEWSRRLNAAFTLLEDHIDLIVQEPDVEVTGDLA